MSLVSCSINVSLEQNKERQAQETWKASSQARFIFSESAAADINDDVQLCEMFIAFGAAVANVESWNAFRR